jgi:hypothetical protein
MWLVGKNRFTLSANPGEDHGAYRRICNTPSAQAPGKSQIKDGHKGPLTSCEGESRVLLILRI